MQVKATYTGTAPDNFRPYTLEITVEAGVEDAAIREFGFNNISIPDLLERNSSNFGSDNAVALKDIQSGVLNARSQIEEPVSLTTSGKTAAARLKA